MTLTVTTAVVSAVLPFTFRVHLFQFHSISIPAAMNLGTTLEDPHTNPGFFSPGQNEQLSPVLCVRYPKWHPEAREHSTRPNGLRNTASTQEMDTSEETYQARGGSEDRLLEYRGKFHIKVEWPSHISSQISHFNRFEMSIPFVSNNTVGTPCAHVLEYYNMANAVSVAIPLPCDILLPSIHLEQGYLPSSSSSSWDQFLPAADFSRPSEEGIHISATYEHQNPDNPFAFDARHLWYQVLGVVNPDGTVSDPILLISILSSLSNVEDFSASEILLLFTMEFIRQHGREFMWQKWAHGGHSAFMYLCSRICSPTEAVVSLERSPAVMGTLRRTTYGWKDVWPEASYFPGMVISLENRSGSEIGQTSIEGVLIVDRDSLSVLERTGILSLIHESSFGRTSLDILGSILYRQFDLHYNNPVDSDREYDTGSHLLGNWLIYEDPSSESEDEKDDFLLSKFPVFIYANGLEDEICTICLCGFQKGEQLRTIPCAPVPHTFHGECIGKWMQKSTTCPIDRNELLSM